MNLVANWAGRNDIHLSSVTTFDPWEDSGHLSLNYDNVGTASNFFQRNDTDRQWRIFPQNAINPYSGSPVSSEFITVGGFDYTLTDFNHNNIVSRVTGYQLYEINKKVHFFISAYLNCFLLHSKKQ